MSKHVVEEFYSKYPEAYKVHGEKGRKACLSDVVNHIKFLEQAAQLNSLESYRDYISWNKTMFTSRSIPFDGLIDVLGILKERLVSFPDMHDILSIVIDDFQEIPHDEGTVTSDDEDIELGKEYLELLLKGEKEKAYDLILSRYQEKPNIGDLYVNILQQVQYLVGYLWHQNEITVAQEHYITQATRLLMSRLYAQLGSVPTSKGKILATCVPGELHDMGLQMVSDLFEMDGWKVIYLGANTPEDSILSLIDVEKPDFLALSVTLPLNLVNAQNLIHRVRNEVPGIKIVAGGYSLNKDEGLWDKLMVDGVAVNAIEAVKIVNKLA